jgi:hypothetical protein
MIFIIRINQFYKIQGLKMKKINSIISLLVLTLSVQVAASSLSQSSNMISSGAQGSGVQVHNEDILGETPSQQDQEAKQLDEKANFDRKEAREKRKELREERKIIREERRLQKEERKELREERKLEKEKRKLEQLKNHEQGDSVNSSPLTPARDSVEAPAEVPVPTQTLMQSHDKSEHLADQLPPKEESALVVPDETSASVESSSAPAPSVGN